MTLVAYLAIGLSVGLACYAYVVYPLILKLFDLLAPPPQAVSPTGFDWPRISISLPIHNEEASIRATLESLLALEYPTSRRQVVVISDGSTDRTEQIVTEFAGQGIELLRLPNRVGKTAAENAAIPYLRGDIVVNTDATTRIPPTSLKSLIGAFRDPRIGVASGRDVSVGDGQSGANIAESRYVNYEMWVRALESRVGSIVGASGCFYAIRRNLHETLLPAGLSRDFASALTARERGYRAVSVDDAICYVPRTHSPRLECLRKIRTMTRGIQTLWYKRGLLDPTRFGAFALMLASHKLARWLVPLGLPAALSGIVMLALRYHLLAALLLAASLPVSIGILGLLWPPDRSMPRLLAASGFVTGGIVAGLMAWVMVMRGDNRPTWEPTRRGAV
jgi:cellulose synthase/poly-beta-1,6-N-acetylglucosamine synthase-like glycosyltransferase